MDELIPITLLIVFILLMGLTVRKAQEIAKVRELEERERE